MADKALDLFEYLYESIGCAHISDLPYIAKQRPLIISRVIAAIRPSDYPLKQWNDALNYLVQASAQSTAEDAYSLLISTLSAAEV